MDQQSTPIVIDKLFKSFAAASSDIIHLNDAAGNIIYTNQAGVDLLGYSKDELLHTPAALLIHPDDAPDIAADMENISPEYAPPAREIRLRKKDGTFLMVEVQGFLVPSSQGMFIGAIIRDISQRKLLEQDRIQFTDTVLKSQLETTLDGILVVDPENNILLTNRRFQKMWGIDPEIAALKDDTIQVQTVLDQLTDPDGFIARVHYLYEHPDETSTDLILLSDGRTFERYSAPLYDMRKQILGRIWYFRDITELKQQEDERLKMQKLESVGVLAGGIAHDFNNILSAILGNIELSAFHIPPDNQAKALLKQAGEACLRAKTLTMQLLTFSKGGEPVKETTRIGTIIKESCQFFLSGSNVSCRFNIQDNLWQVHCDKDQINQVIQNLIINAKQAMPKGGIIDIGCTNIHHSGSNKLSKGNYLRITLTDHGHGISPEILDRIFDPYFTTRAMATNDGTGLGLAVAHSILSKHHGAIEVESELGKGTTFTLFLPAVQQRHPSGNDTNKDGSTGKKHKILVMDDDEMLRNVLTSLIKTLGHEVMVTEDGTQTIRRYRELQEQGSPIDLALLDLTIPGGMGGLQTAEELLKLDPEARLIVASGYSNDPVMSNYRKYGFQAAISKPFILDDLKKAITSILQIEQ